MLHENLMLATVGIRAILRSPTCFCFIARAFPGSKNISTSGQLRSGHSRWATIKHDKAKNDSKKAKDRAIFLNAVTHSAKLPNSPNPQHNGALARAIATAKRQGIQKSSIDDAILRAQGRSSTGAKLENLLVEAFVPASNDAPGPVGIIVEAETDRKAKVLEDLKMLLKKKGAFPTPTGFLFDRIGKIIIDLSPEADGSEEKKATSNDSANMKYSQLEDTALELDGILDVHLDEDGEGCVRAIVDVEPDAVRQVESALVERLRVEVKSSDLVWNPKLETSVTGPSGSYDILRDVRSALEDYSDVRAVYTNLIAAN